MLKVYDAQNKTAMDSFINAFMNRAPGWVVMQPDCSRAAYPAQFVIVTDLRMKLATIQVLQ
jgi:hypothetical protein